MQGIVACSVLHWQAASVVEDFTISPTQRPMVSMMDEGKTKEQLIAELARANDELAIFRKFVEASGQGFSMAAPDGYITYANPALCRMLGEASANVVGTHLSAYFTEESNRRGEQEIRPALDREGRWEGELVMIPRHGTPIPTWHNTFVIRDERGSPFRLAVVITDITARKEAEEALRASEERFRVAFEESPLGMVMGVGDGIVVKINRTLSRLSGYAQDEMIGRHVHEFTHPDDLGISAPHIQRLLAGEIPSFTIQKRYLKKDGDVFWGQTTTAAIRGVNGQIAFMLAIVEDVTARKHAQELLEKERKTLRYLLQSSDHERQTIAYEIHDGLAQFLAGAIMQFDSFAYLRDRKPQEAAKLFESAQALLRRSHFEARRLISGVRPPVLDELGVVEAIAHLVHEVSRQKGPRIEYTSKVDFDRLVPILENAIYRITQESLTNACKHSQSARVRVRLTQRADRVRIEVRDWGIGFDPKDTEEGCFGLEGIRQRARLLGGRCKVRSKPGIGTRIRAEMPLVPREKEG